MEKKWTMGDLIDLEYLLGQEGRVEDQKILEERDRRIYLEKIAPLVVDSSDGIMAEKPLPETLVRLWVSFMGQVQGFLPGAYIDSGFRFLRGLFLVWGFVTGLIVCLSLFSYTGRLPLNVSYFFGVILLPQTLLLLFTLAGLVMMKVRPGKTSRFGIYPALGLALERSAARLFRRGLGRLSGEKQKALLAALGSFRRSRNVNSRLFLWSLFVLMQLFGVGFNLGVLGATLGRVVFFDTAFGWQSSLNLSHDFVVKVVSMISTPWSWAFPAGVGSPSLAQIEGTRLILKDGIYHLATTDLVSWWPFLSLSVVTYALLPRTFLLLLGVFVQRRSLARYSFDSWGIKKLVRRLVTPRVTTEPAVSQETGKASSLEELYGRITRPVNDNNNDRHDHLFQEHGKNQMSESFLALVHDDIFDMLDKEDFKERLLHGLNCRVDTILRTGLDADAEADQTATFKESVAGILLLQEAWLPPIREILAFILKVRTRTPEIPLVVVLIGKPGPDTLLTVPDSQDKKIWAVKIKGLGDPLIDVEDLVTQ
ncbi:MAG: DUF2868 domain-containing protein [Desulfobacterium sp.]|nr:DUF2868 domain-containing protein [Desulfobacterium sp.]